MKSFDDRNKTRWQEQTERTIQTYRKSLETASDTFGAVGWGSNAAQKIRFEIFLDIGNLEGCGVADIGAGLGDFYSFLRSNGFSGHYVGYDVTEEMVNAARGRFHGVDFRIGDVLAMDQVELDRSFDYVFASGLFTYCRHRPYDFLRVAAENMFDLADIGVGLNSLSTWGTKPKSDEFQFDPCRAINALRDITPKLVLRHDYLPHDFTVFLYK